MAKRHYTKYAISIDGHLYSAKYLGMGKFSEVFRVGDRAVYYTKDDCTKEVLALYYYGGVPHLPEIIRHNDVQTNRTYFQCYSSPIYRDVKRTDTSAYRLMNLIMKRHTKFWYKHKEYLYQAYGRVVMTSDVMQAFVDEVREDRSLPYSMVRALQELIDLSRNCGDRIQFDFHKKNFGVNAYGTLILRDVVALSDRV